MGTALGLAWLKAGANASHHRNKNNRYDVVRCTHLPHVHCRVDWPAQVEQDVGAQHAAVARQHVQLGVGRGWRAGQGGFGRDRGVGAGKWGEGSG